MTADSTTLVLEPAVSEPEQTPSSETIRVDGELMEMVRYICFHRRDHRGRRMKHAAYLDQLIREPVQRDYETVRRQIEEANRQPPAEPKKPRRRKD